jgi:hypothetical protein
VEFIVEMFALSFVLCALQNRSYSILMQRTCSATVEAAAAPVFASQRSRRLTYTVVMQNWSTSNERMAATAAAAMASKFASGVMGSTLANHWLVPLVGKSLVFDARFGSLDSSCVDDVLILFPYPRIAAVISSTLVLDHFLIQMFRFPSTGGVKNRELTVYDAVRSYAYALVSFATISAHMGFTIANRQTYSFEMPTLLQLAIYLPITLAVQDIYHYFVHRWIHSQVSKRMLTRAGRSTSAYWVFPQTYCPKWIRNIHAPHHKTIHPTTGMLTTDLFAANPIEYWYAAPCQIAGWLLLLSG